MRHYGSQHAHEKIHIQYSEPGTKYLVTLLAEVFSTRLVKSKRKPCIARLAGDSV